MTTAIASDELLRLTGFARCAGCAAKLGLGDLSEALKRVPHQTDPRLLVGRETFDDAGVFLLAPDLALVQTVDFFAPIVDDPYLFGQIAAANALSDVYAMGGEPLTALNIVGFPSGKLPLDVLGRILQGGQDKVHEAGALVVGGHTIIDEELKFGLAVTGRVHPDHLLTNAAAKPGARRGRVTRQKTERRRTPSECPTSSSPTGDRATAARTETTAMGKNITA